MSLPACLLAGAFSFILDFAADSPEPISSMPMNIEIGASLRPWRRCSCVKSRVFMRKATVTSELVFALDASIIDLSLKLFPWAYFARTYRSAVKLHTLLSLRGTLPAWAAVTEVNFPEMKMLDEIPLAAGAFYVLDRAYLDFTRLIRL